MEQDKNPFRNNQEYEAICETEEVLIIRKFEIFRVLNSKNKLDLNTHLLVIEQSVKAKNPHLTIEIVKSELINIFSF